MENYTPYYLIEYGTNPNNADTDGDLIIDSYETMTGFWSSEFNTGTSPVEADSDDDGLDDGYEITIDTNPTNRYSDYDFIFEAQSSLFLKRNSVSLTISPVSLILKSVIII